jgi:regulator of nonsense transcripts 1
VPPFGQDDDPNNLPSIFEVGHLRGYAYFLNTQCLFSFFLVLFYSEISDLILIDRMPPQMGDLISGAVYDSLLRSFSGHIIKKSTIATHFVDVPSKEKRKEDSYWVGLALFIFANINSSLFLFFLSQNEDERNVVLQIAKHLQDQGMDYKIISPYDAQRNAIESKMKGSPDLNWESKCFNVDSFQGQFLNFLFYFNFF